VLNNLTNTELNIIMLSSLLFNSTSLPGWCNVGLATVLLSLRNADPHELQAPVKATNICRLRIERLVLKCGIINDVHDRYGNDSSVFSDAAQQWLQPSCSNQQQCYVCLLILTWEYLTCQIHICMPFTMKPNEKVNSM